MSHVNMGGMNGANAPMGAMPMLNHAPNGATPARMDADEQESLDYSQKLNAYIYDYFLGQSMFDCARAMIKSRVPMDPQPGNAENQMNGTDKDPAEHKKAADLPASNAQGSESGAFLIDWFGLFWDIFNAQRSRGHPQARQNNASRYIEHNTAAQKMRQEQQSAMLKHNNTMSQMDLHQQMLRPNTMQMNGDLRKQVIQARGMGITPQHMAQIQMNEHMRRNPSEMEMNGQRPRTPSSDNAPSPNKRPRLDGANPGFNPAARGGFPPQMLMDGRPNPNMVKNGMDPNAFGAAAYEPNMNMRLPIMPNGIAGQGSPMMQQGMEFANSAFVADGRPGALTDTGGLNGNHALQDYQMQLMLLEKQNKKRLLIARQEQNTDRPDGPPPGYSSPNGSRSGPSPGPGEPMGKRGSPPMGPGGIPQSPLPNGVMPQDRGSPGTFMGQQMQQDMFQPKMENGMPGVGPGAAMMRAGPGFNPQQAEAMARIRPGAQMATAPTWPQGQPPQAPMMQQSQSQQAAPMGTPQPRTAMAPPPSVPAAGTANGRTASPAPSAAPPTPQQTNKANPKGKKDAKDRKKPAKKGSTAAATGATPSADPDAQPPTPTPATPITPQHPSSFSGVKGEAPAPAIGGPIPAAPTNIAAPSMDNMAMGFDPLQGMDAQGFNMDFAGLDAPEVMQSFDFDSLLNNDADDYNMEAINFASAMSTGDGVEAAGLDNP